MTMSRLPSRRLRKVSRELPRKLKDRAWAYHGSLNNEIIATLQSITNQTQTADVDKMIAQDRRSVVVRRMDDFLAS